MRRFEKDQCFKSEKRSVCIYSISEYSFVLQKKPHVSFFHFVLICFVLVQTKRTIY